MPKRMRWYDEPIVKKAVLSVKDDLHQNDLIRYIEGLEDLIYDRLQPVEENPLHHVAKHKKQETPKHLC